MTEIESQGLDKLQNAIGQLHGPLLEKFKSRVTYYVALALKGIIKPYKPQHTPIIWPSAKARRYYFAMRREAKLPMKYTRGSDPMSQRLQQSWDITRRPTEAILGNRATYAPYVASDQFQIKQHAATGFTTDKEAEKAIRDNGTFKRIVDAHIRAIVQEAFRGI